jgi:hypothetical protein
MPYAPPQPRPKPSGTGTAPAPSVRPTAPQGTRPGGTTTRPKTPAPYAPNKAQLDAEARAKAERDAERKKAGQRYMDEAANLEAQAVALQNALNGTFKQNLDSQLANVGQAIAAQMEILKSGHAQRSASFDRAAADTESAASGEQNQGLSNMVRERQDAMTAILEQGAGETDAARAMLMSARNWNANAAESNRAYFDSIRSVNEGLTDLNVDTRTGMANAFMSGEAEKGRLWQDYYNRMSETRTQLGNIRGQQGSYYAQAKEMGVDPGARAAEVQAEMAAQYNAATDEAGKVYAQQALPGEIKDWEGAALKKGKQSNTNLAAATTIGPAQKAEGASLRRWKG